MAEEREITTKNQFIINRKANESHGCPKIFLSDIKSCFFLLSKVSRFGLLAKSLQPCMTVSDDDDDDADHV